MAKIKPFKALRPVTEKAKQVSCVPYDVIGDAEVRSFIQKNSLSFLRVTRSEADFGVSESVTADDAFRRAAENLQNLIEDGTFLTEHEPSLYVYRLENETNRQTGIVGCVSLDDYENGLIKKHEKVRPDKVDDRTRHMLKVNAQTGLIFLTYRDDPCINKLVEQTTALAPIYDFNCLDNVRHTVWKVESAEPLVDAFSDVPALYVADGHHRIESAARARKILSENNSGGDDEEFNYVVAGIFPASELKILAYNRVVRDLGGLSARDFLARVSESFVVSGSEQKSPSQHGEICMYLGSEWFTLMFNVQYYREPDVIERLDVSILQDHILKPILGIDDPRTDERIGFIGGRRGVGELERIVDNGEAVVAFSLFPTTMEDLLEVSDQNEVMPPKSTWFEPKLKDGLLVHLI